MGRLQFRIWVVIFLHLPYMPRIGLLLPNGALKLPRPGFEPADAGLSPFIIVRRLPVHVPPEGITLLSLLLSVKPVLFVSSIAPGLRSLSPGASLELLAKVGPRSTRFFAISATATIVFGLGLLSALPGLLGTNIVFGIAIGLVAYMTAIVTMLSFNKADHLAKEMLAGGQAGPPPPEFVAALKRSGIAVTVTALLLVVALVFAVAAGFPF